MLPAKSDHWKNIKNRLTAPDDERLRLKTWTRWSLTLWIQLETTFLDSHG